MKKKPSPPPKIIPVRFKKSEYDEVVREAHEFGGLPVSTYLKMCRRTHPKPWLKRTTS